MSTGIEALVMPRVWEMYEDKRVTPRDEPRRRSSCSKPPSRVPTKGSALPAYEHSETIKSGVAIYFQTKGFGFVVLEHWFPIDWGTPEDDETRPRKTLP